MQAVVERLEAEAADNRQAARQEAEERETALKGRYQAALQAAQDSELKHAERSVPLQAVPDCVLDLLHNFEFSSVFSLAGNTCSSTMQTLHDRRRRTKIGTCYLHSASRWVSIASFLKGSCQKHASITAEPSPFWHLATKPSGQEAQCSRAYDCIMMTVSCTGLTLHVTLPCMDSSHVQP